MDYAAVERARERLEAAAEARTQQADVDAALDRARAQGLVVFVSDTPHSEEVVRGLLAAQGLATDADLVFTSSERGATKSRGGLFEVVAEAREFGALVEGEIEQFKRVEDESENADSEAQSLETALTFIRTTGVDVYAPAIGNAHGMYTTTPKLDNQRVTDIVAATGIPVALHGGTGMSPDQFSDLIARGCAKVNISTALKIAFIQSGYDYVTANPTEYDPPKLFVAQRAAVLEMAKEHIGRFGAQGRAW